MKKVKLTESQVDAFEFTNKFNNLEFNVRKHMNGWTDKRTLCLNSLSLKDYLKALYIGYEVEPVYHLKELVKYGECIFEIYQIPRIGAVNLKSELGSTISHVPVTEIEKLTNDELSTEKTRRWWSSNHRDVNELKTDDVVLNTQTDKIYTISKFSNKKLLTYEKVICFAQERKDIDADSRAPKF